jgi:hypothetical protein
LDFPNLVGEDGQNAGQGGEAHGFGMVNFDGHSI